MDEVRLQFLINDQVLEITSGPDTLFLWNFRTAGVLPGLTVDHILGAIEGLLKNKIQQIQRV